MRTAAIVLAVLAFAAPAQAHLIGHFHGKTLNATIAYQEKQYAHARYVCVRGTGEPKRWHCAASQWISRELARTRAKLIPAVNYGKWACIHSKEGAWNANTGNGYYGGLQMDWDFMEAHGAEYLHRWGTADHWPVWAQIAAAEDAYRERGFWPWPNTARMCGLL